MPILWNILDHIEKLIDLVFEKIPYNKLVSLNVRIRWAVVGCVPLLIIVVFYFALISSVSVETAKLKEELINSKQQVAINRNIERNLPKLIKQLNDLDYQLGLMRLQLPEEKEIPNLLDQLSNLGIQSGLEFLTFKPVQETVKDFYAEVPVELKIVGPFHNLVAFYDKVSRMPRIVTISNIDIAPYAAKEKTTPAGRLVQANCMAVTYMFIESRVDEPKKEEK